MLVPLLALAMISPDDRGSVLYADCKSFVAALDHTANQGHIDTLGASRCSGYIEGILDGANGLRGFCAENATVGTIARVYIAYMDKNPKMFDEREGTGFISALQENYPCPAK
jgi:hypothetical protein